MRSPIFILLALGVSTPALAAGQAEPAPPPPTTNTAEPVDAAPPQDEPDEIVVIATRIKGSVDAPQPPVATLTEADVASYGASSLADLLTALAPQTGSGRGRGSGPPAILVNGQRIGSFREMRNYPPEAIRRVEILPEEVALRYGFAPNQRVVNFILKDNFSSRSAELQYRQPTRGGTGNEQFEVNSLLINGPRRVNASVELNHTSPLTEAERNVIQADATTIGGIGQGTYRSLIAESTDLTGNVTFNTALGTAPGSGTLGLNANVARGRTLSYSGLNTASLTAVDPLARQSDTLTLSGGAALNKPLGDWQLTLTADGSHGETVSHIDRRGAFGFDRAETYTDSLNTLATVIGRPVHLPAGDVSVTAKTGLNLDGISSRDSRRLTTGETSLSRREALAGINVGVPIASRRNDVLAGLGDLTLNASAGISNLSDFGTLKDWSAGFNWGLTEKLNLGLSYIVNEAAPSLGNLGNPQLQNFNVPVYDFARGETALVTVITGGNPALKKETQRDLKASLNWQLPFLQNSNVLVEYFRNRSNDITASFPVLTPAIEAAFPGRVVRDANGRLVSIDQRPVTLYRQESSRLRLGFNLSGNLGKAPEGGGGMFGGGGGRRGGGGGRGGGMGGPPGGGMGGPPGGGQGRWNVALYDTVQFTNKVTIAPAGPVLDLLGGDALSGGGIARHTLELDAGAFKSGLGVRLSGSYTAPTRVDASGLPGSTDLRFGSLFKLNLRTFANLDQVPGLTKGAPFLRGTRMSVFVNNIFDQRQRVTDGNGTVPINYQPDLIDPQGRVIGIEIRKSF
ncbi:TonB-dependent receptor [Parablastomonas sp. CN1-191]|uniref:TonB-dependent receptor n=1 Tax=Parablastomonas sp. CN1-191 TaxID=3400908 RepID=UPI003BF910D0